MLTRIALFNSAAVFLDQIVLLAVALVLTPAIIAAVGAGGFGVWQLIVRWTGYVSLMDGRSHELLKWKISRNSSGKDKALRRNVGAALFVWLTYLPLMFLVGLGFLAWLSSRSLDVGIDSNIIVLTAVIMTTNALLVGLRSFPEAVLRGSNKGYKQIGIRSLIVFMMGGVSIYIVNNGYGLIGLACVQSIGTLILFLAFQLVTKRNVHWYGLSVPLGEELISSYRVGFWYFAWSLVNFSFVSLDVIILGFFASADNVAVFVVTYFAVQTITHAVSTALSATLPGMGSLLRDNKSQKMVLIRSEGIVYCWWLSISISVSVLAFNESFVSLWVGKESYAGYWQNLLIVLMSLQMVFVRNDSLIINVLLDQKEKVKVTLYAVIVIIGLSILLVPTFNIAGMCVAFIVGRLMVLFLYPRIIARHTGLNVRDAFQL